MSVKNVLLFIAIYIGGFALAIAGSVCELGASMLTLWFVLSVFFLIVGFSFLFWVPIYQRARYITILQNKYREVEGQSVSGKRVQKGTFLKQHALSTQSKIFIGCFILAVVFALVPTVCDEGFISVLNIFRTTMQFFAVDGGLSDLIDNVDGFYYCYVAVLCVTAGLLFAYNIVIIFAKEFCAYMNYCIPHPFSAIYVMSELNEKSVTLAESILVKHQECKKDKKSDMRPNPRFYFCDAYQTDNEEAAELISRAWQLGAVIMKRDITELRIKLGAKSNTFYFIGVNEEENINQAQHINEAYKKKDIKRKLRVYIYASRAESEMLIDDINAQFYNIVKKENGKDYPLTIRRIDEHYRFALDFFWEHGGKFFKSVKDGNGNGEIKVFRVGFVGFGEYAYELLKTLCCLGQLPACRLIIYIFDKDAKSKMAKFQQELLVNRFNKDEGVLESADGITEAGKEELEDIKYHDNPFYELHFIECDVEQNGFIESSVKKRFTHMFFLLGNDEKNIDIATKVSVAYSREKLNFDFYAMIRNDATMAQLRRLGGTFGEDYPHINLFGANCERYSYENIAEDRIEEVAKQIHKNYCINKIFADIYGKVESYIEDLAGDEYGLILNSFKLQLYSMKDEILREWRKSPDISSREVEKIISDDKYENIIKSLEKIKLQGKVSDVIKELRSEILNLWDVDVLNKEFYKEEYFRRSSKARALFEKLLFDLGFLCTNAENKNIFVCKNVVPEFVGDDDWALKDDQKAQYLPKNIPFYLVLERKSQKYKDGYDEKYYEYLKNSPYQYFAKYKLEDGHLNSQWFEVNNIFQKRWIVFRWGEGYQKSKTNEACAPRNKSSKTHSYIIPYSEIYLDDYMRIRHTVYVYLPKEGDRARLGYNIEIQ